MRILLLTHWLSNRGGGVPVVVAALARSLSRIDGGEVHVMGLVTDPSEQFDQDWGAAIVHPVLPAETRLIGYAPEMDRLITRIAPDVVHLHGLWTYASVAAGRWRAHMPAGRLVISPHGMLDPWALANSGWKKRLAGAAFQRRTCDRADLMHALTGAEADDIHVYCGRGPVAVVPNGVDRIDAADAGPTSHDGRQMLYLGRIHPKKNIGYLLDLWARSGATGQGWQLRIAGWDQDGTQARLLEQVNRLGIGGTVAFLGPLFGDEKDAAFRAADAFVLPSLSEGLPMVVLEAWSYGLPVVMTDACNLPDGFETGAAHRLGTADAKRGARELTNFLALPKPALDEMGAAGRALVQDAYLWDAVARKFGSAYDWALEHTDKPDFIRE